MVSKRSIVFMLLGAIALLGATACVVSGRVNAGATVDPTLVEVSPGVWVVEDYDEPVFYSEGSYWLYRDNVWYSSNVHTGGWVVRSAPSVVVRIGRPQGYVRYRARAGARYRSGPRGSVRVRDNRGPVRRDNRRDVRDHRQDVRDDRREHRQDAQDDRREHRQEGHDDRREHRQDAQDDRREHRQDGHDDRRENHQEKREEKREEKHDDKKHDDRHDDKGESRDHRRHR